MGFDRHPIRENIPISVELLHSYKRSCMLHPVGIQHLSWYLLSENAIGDSRSGLNVPLLFVVAFSP